MFCTFTDEELDHLYSLATERNAPKKHIPTKHSNHLSNIQVHYVGLKAELCFSKYFNIPINTSITPLGDDGYDFILLNGLTVDVKLSSRDLRFCPDKGMVSDIVVLCSPYGTQIDPYFRHRPAIGDMALRNMNMAGFINRDIFNEKSYEKILYGQGSRILVNKEDVSTDWHKLLLRHYTAEVI